VSGGSNLLTNPGFETSGGWTEAVSSVLGNSTSMTMTTWGFTSPKTGSVSYSFTNDAYGTVRSDQFAVSGGQGYDVSAWI
jgi:hypothetical protein